MNLLISKINVLIDINERIRGVILVYDFIDKYELYPKDISNEMFKPLEIHMDMIDRKTFIKNKKNIKIVLISLILLMLLPIFLELLNKLIISFHF